ncbi:toxin-antitoxin system YwqK family antitoxin [Flavobacterium aquidurense]|uniref:MORN repeat protein n=1 Tax=Flavobacterium aquidurense TaxID=362413 RepID=A0A0Q0S0A9_9FLAO|nr:hypothetical protein [Flavobacterium aquidurense]KQB38374.1 hypothetical protein RC62_1729 [Flavobacterium aquidurense]
MTKKNKILTIIFFSILLGIVVLYFWSSTEKKYVLREYYPNRKQASEYEYVIKDVDTILHGKFIRYNKEGNKIAEGNFVNGEPTGKSIYYFDNGTIESIFYRKNSKIIQEITENYPSGKIMQYTLYDYLGLSAFIAGFDKQGNIDNYEGYPIMETYQYRIANKKRFKTKIEQYLKVGDTLKQQYLVANIPNTKRSLKIENLDIDNTKAKRTFKKTSQTGIEVKEILIKKGINKIRAVVKYEFNDKNKTVINDTISFKVKVN